MTATTNDPFLQTFFGRVPADVADSFTPAQLDAIKRAFGARSRGSHAVDLRFSLPLASAYVVLLVGREHRPASRRAMERALRPVWTLANAIIILTFVLMLLASAFAVLYTGKRTLGIDLFPGIDMLPDQKIERMLK